MRSQRGFCALLLRYGPSPLTVPPGHGTGGHSETGCLGGAEYRSGETGEHQREQRIWAFASCGQAVPCLGAPQRTFRSTTAPALGL
jgi:hypothetical protein